MPWTMHMCACLVCALFASLHEPIDPILAARAQSVLSAPHGVPCIVLGPCGVAPLESRPTCLSLRSVMVTAPCADNAGCLARHEAATFIITSCVSLQARQRQTRFNTAGCSSHAPCQAYYHDYFCACTSLVLTQTGPNTFFTLQDRHGELSTHAQPPV